MTSKTGTPYTATALFSHASRSFVFGKLPTVGVLWAAGVLAVLLVVVSPVLYLIWTALNSSGAHWQHLMTYVLPKASLNTALLLLGVGALSLLLGTGCAWLVTAYDFTGRRWCAWALLLPMAIPSYIIAYAYTDLLHPIGPIQTALRFMLGYDSPRQWRMPDVRSLTGAIILLGLVLYPYVYLSARAAFLTQPAQHLEAARTLGYKPLQVFMKVVLPLARPALAVGLSLSLLETLNDIGASEFLGIQTLTVSIYTTWITRSDLASAAQIAICMLAMVMLLMGFEQYSRRRLRFTSSQTNRTMQPQRLTGIYAILALALALLPVLLGFVLPAGFLLQQTIKHVTQTDGGISGDLIRSGINTIGMSLAVTALTLFAGLLVAWAARQSISSKPAAKWLAQISGIGYALPGTVIAIGLLPPLMAFDIWLSDTWGLPNLPIMSSGALVLIGCSVRFLAIASNSLSAGLTRQSPSLEQAARLLGNKPARVLWRVHLPLLRPAFISAALLIFVDAMKELPATLLLRPPNFETLATALYAEAARGTYEEGAIAALGIVLVGIIPVIILARQQERHLKPNSPKK